MSGRLKQFQREMRAYPRQFWLLTAGIFVYVGGAALAFPYEGIYLHRDLHVSMSWIGFVFGVVPLAVSPLQIWGGHLTDRFGRRRMIVLALWMGVVWFVGFAFVRQVWQVALLVAVESSFGWPLFQTAANAMIADLLEPQHRAEGFSITRIAMNVGVVIGPALAGFALALGWTFRQLFLAAAVGCLAAMVIAAAWFRETRPTAAARAQVPTGEAGLSGYRLVFADRRFLIFCLVSVLPVFCIGQFGSIYSVFITDTLGVGFGTWGLLLAMNAFIVAAVQYPLIRKLKGRDPMVLLAVSSGLLAVGMGFTAFAFATWPLIVLVAVISFGEILLSPVATTVVGDMAPEAVRGRYMGVWTVVWNGGASLGPTFGGLAMDRLGGRQAFVIIMVVGAAGAALFPLLRERRGQRLPRRLGLRRAGQ